MSRRVTADDLLLAAEWMESYEDAGQEGDDETTATMHRVGRWLRAQAEQRNVRSLATKAGVSLGRAKAVLAAIRAKGSP